MITKKRLGNINMSLSVNIQWDKELSLKLKKLSESDLLAAKNKILRTANYTFFHLR